MALYIVRPKQDQILGLSLGTRRISQQERAVQVQQISSLRAADAPQQDLDTAIRDYHGTTLFGGPQQTPVTGVQLVELPDEQGERMRRERSDLLVLRDQPIGLIESEPASRECCGEEVADRQRSMAHGDGGPVSG